MIMGENMRKKILFTAYSLGLGGIEKALINLLCSEEMKKYDITLILEKKEGIFLDLLPKNVRLLEYKIFADKNILFRKIKNRIKLIYWKIRLHHKFDCSISFATYSIPGAHLALSASKNNILWMHANYYITYDRDEKKMKDFLDSILTKKFNRIVFVSHENMREITKHYPEINKKSIVCNNLINYEEILKKSKEKIHNIKKEKNFVFVNVGRHEEHQKRLSRIFYAVEKLKKEGYQFKLWLIGDGPDTDEYKKIVHEKAIDDYVCFFGKKQNPYPYLKMGDAVLLSSEYEGYPVVFVESMVLNKPIISTKVSDYEELENKAGIFVDCTKEGVYLGMKQFLDKGFIIKDKFNPKKYNQNIMKKLTMMIEGNDYEK